ncbi:hypothetical protein ACOKFD_16270 [Flagellimonas sp. S174]|uniref:hypothetical protein n=1 Tax=Flagellimonas sp. S174 TaxID=3410790 RepID=UPI003BF5E722
MRKKFAFLFSLLLFSCSSEDKVDSINTGETLNDGDTNNTVSFNVVLQKNSYSPYEVINFDIDTNVSLDGLEIGGFFDGQEVIINRNPAGNYSFFVPNLNSGSYVLEITSNNSLYSDSRTISLTEFQDIPDPEIQVSSFIDTFQSFSIDSNLDTESEEYIRNEYAETLLAFFEQEVQNLSPQELQELANYISVNDIGLDLGESTISLKTNNYELVRRLSGRLLSKQGVMATLIGALGVSLIIPDVTVSKALAAGLAVSLVYNLIELLKIEEELIDAIFIPIESFLDEGNANKGKQNKKDNVFFISGRPKTFNIRTRGRRLVQDDVNHPSDLVSSAAISIGRAKFVHFQINSQMDAFTSLFGSEPGLSENRTFDPVFLPTERSLVDVDLPIESFTVSNTGNGISSAINGQNNMLSITLDNGSAYFEPTQINPVVIFNDSVFRFEYDLGGFLFSKFALVTFINNTNTSFSNCGSGTCNPNGWSTSFIVNGQVTELIPPGGRVTVEVEYGTYSWNITFGNGLAGGTRVTEINPPITTRESGVQQCCNVGAKSSNIDTKQLLID